jgi:hypothetical protein
MIGLVLAHPSPCLRYLALRDLFDKPEEDPERRELASLRDEDPLVRTLGALQRSNGSWGTVNESEPGVTRALMSTSRALCRLGYLGYNASNAIVARGAGYLFGKQRPDGSWPLEQSERDDVGGYSMIPLQTAVPLWALALCGFAEDPRAGRAYEWLAEQRLADGAWPTGIASGNYGRVAGYRRLAHSRWGCRSNTTGALLCLAAHPALRTGELARKALELLLGRETRETTYVGFEVARIVGAEPIRGFLTHFARFDLAQILELCALVGADAGDPRVRDLVKHIEGLRSEYGLWEYRNSPAASAWVTFDILRSLRVLAGNEGFFGIEPRTPFAPYPRRPHRY